MALVIAGRIVPMSGTDPSAVFPGRIYLGDDGFVDAVTNGTHQHQWDRERACPSD